MSQCNGINKNGKPCTSNSALENGFCFFHQGQTEQEKPKKKSRRLHRKSNHFKTPAGGGRLNTFGAQRAF